MIRRFLNTQVTIKEFLGDGAYGPSFADGVDVLCRIEFSNRITKSLISDEVLNSLTAIFLPDTKISVGSLVTYNGKDYTVVNLVAYNGTAGQSHIVAVVQ